MNLKYFTNFKKYPFIFKSNIVFGGTEIIVTNALP